MDALAALPVQVPDERQHVFTADKAFIPVKMEGSHPFAHLGTVLTEWGMFGRVIGGAVGEAVIIQSATLGWPHQYGLAARFAQRLILANIQGKEARSEWSTTRLVCQSHREGPGFQIELSCDWPYHRKYVHASSWRFSVLRHHNINVHTNSARSPTRPCWIFPREAPPMSRNLRHIPLHRTHCNRLEPGRVQEGSRMQPRTQYAGTFQIIKLKKDQWEFGSSLGSWGKSTQEC